MGQWGFAAKLLAALGAFLVAIPCQAEELALGHDVRLDVHGVVPQRCSMGTPGGVNFGDLRRENIHAELSVGLYCNVPFRIELRAQHGALTNDRQPNGEGPYSGSVPYQFGLSMPLRTPTVAVMDRQFDGAALVGGQTVSSGGGIALDGMELRVSLGKPASEAGLLAGTYSENIVITVATT